jgi:hypothetical protein
MQKLIKEERNSCVAELLVVTKRLVQEAISPPVRSSEYSLSEPYSAFSDGFILFM